MTTYTSDYTALRRDGYAYTYALIDYITGEIRTSSCDLPTHPLRHLFQRMDGIRRECRRGGSACHLVLANCCTGEVIAFVETDFGENRIEHLYEMLEGK
jgi:hypothetical protein